MRKIHRNNVLIDVLALQALVNDARGDELAAMEKLEAALALGEPGGFIRTFSDMDAQMANLLVRFQEQKAGGRRAEYVTRLLAGFPDEARETRKPEPAPARIQPPGMPLTNPLTRREVQIVELLATDLSPQEIAAKLVISPATVYTHTKSIYRKLDVHKRTEAVQRAREVDLIP